MPRSLLAALPILGIAFCLAGGPADAALGSPWWQVGGGAAGDSLGWSVGGAPDLDGDGRGDVIVGVPDDDDGGLSNVGSVRVFSGVDGQFLWAAVGDRVGGGFGRAVAGVADLDGDDLGDVIVGAPFDRNNAGLDAGSVSVYSGASGALLWSAFGDKTSDMFGAAVAGVPDVDGDGYGDVVVGAPGDDLGLTLNVGIGYVYSGATGVLLWSLAGTAADDHLGSAVGGVDDVDGDGLGDVIVGAPDDDAPGLSTCGSAQVLSGATGTLLWARFGDSAGDRFGCAVAGARDLDGAGTPGVVVGANLDDPSGRSNAGSVYALAGATGTLLWSHGGATANDQFGLSVAGGADVDADGYGDVIAGTPQATVGGVSTAGTACVLSGQTGATLWQTSGAVLADAVGRGVSFVPDVDGDGRGDVVVGASGVDASGLSNSGQASVYATEEATLDVTPPSITCPDDVLAEATSLSGAVVTYSVSATDDVDPAPTVTCEPASGSTFPLGSTTVTCTAVDASGNESTCSFTVTVVDTTAPEVACSVAIASLWPPDHRMQDVGLSVSVSDTVDPNATLSVVVYSDEAPSPGETDAVYDGSLSLRADRDGTGDGRVYLILVAATDATGNSSTATCTVVVPKSESRVMANGARAQAAGAADASRATGGAAPSGYATVLEETTIP